MSQKHYRENFTIDFVGIGAYKSATTWIYQCLKEHPEIFVVSYKSNPMATLFLDPVFQDGVKLYESLFTTATPNQLKGEFTEMYYIQDSKITTRMRENNPVMKIIVCLRNPIERAWSQYLHRLSVDNKKWNSFEQAIEEDYNVILDRGFYHKHLKKFYDCFPEENIYVALYDHVQTNPSDVLKKIQRFLDVDPNFISPFVNLKVSPSNFKRTILGKIIYSLTPSLKKSRWTLKITQKSTLRQWFYRFSVFYVSHKHQSQSIKQDTVFALKKLYAEDIKKLQNLINHDLTFWL